jgi:hypothetical protein
VGITRVSFLPEKRKGGGRQKVVWGCVKDGNIQPKCTVASRTLGKKNKVLEKDKLTLWLEKNSKNKWELSGYFYQRILNTAPLPKININQNEIK